MVERVDLVPESIRTEVVQHRKPSVSGFARRMMVTVGDDHTLEAKYVLLGSVRQIDLWTSDLEGHNDEGYTIKALFRNHDQLEADGLVGELDQSSITVNQLATRFRSADREQLMSGPFAVVTRPDTSSQLIEGVDGVWARTEVVFGEAWEIKSKPDLYDSPEYAQALVEMARIKGVGGIGSPLSMDTNVVEQEPKEEIPVEDIFRLMRRDMGHKWSEGSFGEPTPKIIEGKGRPVDPELSKLVLPENLTSSKEG